MELEFLDHQYKFLTSKKKYTALIAGIGAGKTYCGSAWVLDQVLAYPNALGGIFANSYKQLLNSTLSGLFNFLDDVGMKFEYNQQKSILNVNGSRILCMSTENYNILRGVELGFAWPDEAGYSDEEFWKVLVGRMRDKRGSLKIRVTSTPCGFNWMYDYFSGDKKTDNHELIQASTKDNPFLPESYVHDLYQNSYDSKLIDQELEGLFVNVQSGRIYYAFNREKNIQNVERRDYPIIVGMDFNLNPMTAVIAQIYDDKVHVIDEVWLSNSNTEEMAKYLLEKFGKVQIVCDSTGKKQTTNATHGQSDIKILKDYGHNVLPSRNPFRIDRYNSVNSLLDKNKILINNKASKLIRDLEQVSYKDGTNLPETNSNSELTHPSDALGYLCFYYFPLLPKRIASVNRYA